MVAVVCATVGILLPAGLAPLLTLLALAAQFTIATHHLSGPVLLALTPAEAALLWLIHVLFALAGATASTATVRSPSGVRQTLARTAAGLTVAVPVVVAMLLAAEGSEADPAIRGVGVTAAIVTAALPVYLLHAHLRRRQRE
jgi:hypothetical protein